MHHTNVMNKRSRDNDALKKATEMGSMAKMHVCKIIRNWILQSKNLTTWVKCVTLAISCTFYLFRNVKISTQRKKKSSSSQNWSCSFISKSTVVWIWTNFSLSNHWISWKKSYTLVWYLFISRVYNSICFSQAHNLSICICEQHLNWSYSQSV